MDGSFFLSLPIRRLENLTMKLKSLFLSAALTTFILVVIAGVIKTGANGFLPEGNSAQVAVAQAPQATDPPQPTDPPQATDTLQPTVSPFISSQEAIALASARLGSSDLYSIETTKLGGLDVYKVTFSSGNMVYVSPQGHILLVTSLAQIQEQLTAAGGSSGGSSPPRTSSSSSHGDDSGGGDD
jgi:uncharacterized membrane protein YgcG